MHRHPDSARSVASDASGPRGVETRTLECPCRDPSDSLGRPGLNAPPLFGSPRSSGTRRFGARCAAGRLRSTPPARGRPDRLTATSDSPGTARSSGRLALSRHPECRGLGADDPTPRTRWMPRSRYSRWRGRNLARLRRPRSGFRSKLTETPRQTSGSSLKKTHAISFSRASARGQHLSAAEPEAPRPFGVHETSCS